MSSTRHYAPNTNPLPTNYSFTTRLLALSLALLETLLESLKNVREVGKCVLGLTASRCGHSQINHQGVFHRLRHLRINLYARSDASRQRPQTVGRSRHENLIKFTLSPQVFSGRWAYFSSGVNNTNPTAGWSFFPGSWPC